MSYFIEKSKHAEMTSAVTSHFGTAKKRSMPGEADGKSFAKFGDNKYNNTEMPFHEETGVNHRTDPGHTVK